jgi:alginate O-acetyltransferase complex protein AlgI
MLFNSIEFLEFFVVVTLSFFLLPHKLRWLLLLIASCFFYMFFKPVYILILAFTIVIDYFAGILIENSTEKKRFFLVCSLIANIGVLAVFKYYNFINENISGLCGLFGYHNQIPYLKILLPIGLSFHTFQAMSYTIEVYRGNQKAERHFGIYALYVMFYPQLVAGPIERPQNLLHQFHEKHEFNAENMMIGLRQMLWGFFKKVVIADRLATYVTPVYKSPQSYNKLSLIMATVFFAYQLYYDFSGYSDIAIGAARVMGFKLMTNFNHPFQSKNITEYWRRWHISLSTWFNDYLFTPVVIARRDWGKYGVALGLFVTFVVSGIWHGAGWNFVIWGALHSLAMIYEFLTKKMRRKLSERTPKLIYNLASQLLTFVFLLFAWIFFRAQTFNDACIIIAKIFSPHNVLFQYQGVKSFGTLSFVIAFATCLYVLILERFIDANLSYFNARPKADFLFASINLVMIVCFGVYEKQLFIYFQF